MQCCLPECTFCFARKFVGLQKKKLNLIESFSTLFGLALNRNSQFCARRVHWNCRFFRRWLRRRPLLPSRARSSCCRRPSSATLSLTMSGGINIQSRAPQQKRIHKRRKRRKWSKQLLATEIFLEAFGRRKLIIESRIEVDSKQVRISISAEGGL